MDDFLYHVTYAGRLGRIATLGLLPGQSSTFGGAYLAHSLGKIFLTEADGVFFWHHRVGAQVVPIESAADIPAVLRFQPTEEEEALLEEDVIGSEDARAAAYMTEADIEPHRLDVWDGEGWVSLDGFDGDDFLQYLQDAAEYVEEDEEEWYEHDEDILLPLEFNP